jgi:hypothetical protein
LFRFSNEEPSGSETGWCRCLDSPMRSLQAPKQAGAVF